MAIHNEPGQNKIMRGAAGTDTACVELVPLVYPAGPAGIIMRQPSRADFVTHLIATAEHAPQTRALRRATPADARIAYSANFAQSPGAATRLRQIV
jgi:hypothetical protein